MTDPMTRIALLERAVAALAARPTRRSEELSANNYSVDSSGNVNLTGINLVAGTSIIPGDESHIRWRRRSDGAVVADLFAWEGGVRDSLEVLAVPTADTQVVELRLGTDAPTGTRLCEALLKIIAGRNADPASTTELRAIVITALSGTDIERVILNGAGASDYLQLASTQQLRLSFGIAVVTWAGGTSLASLTNINHGLGPAPPLMFTTANASGQGSVVATHAHAHANPSTQFDLQAAWVNESQPPPNFQMNINWIALG